MFWETYRKEVESCRAGEAAEARFLQAAMGEARPRGAARWQGAAAIGASAACVALGTGIALLFLRLGPEPLPRGDAPLPASSAAATAPAGRTDALSSAAGMTEPTPGSSDEKTNAPSASAVKSSTGSPASTGVPSACKTVAGKFVPMTYAEICAFYGRDPLPADLPVPADLEAQETRLGIYEGEDVKRWNIRWDFNSFVYAGKSGRRAVITVAKNRLPKAEEWHLGDPFEVNGTTVYAYSYDDRVHSGTLFYTAYMLVDGIGYSVETENLTEEEFQTIVRALA